MGMKSKRRIGGNYHKYQHQNDQRIGDHQLIENVLLVLIVLLQQLTLIMQSTSVICGIDIGSWSIKISVFSGDGFQVLTNEANFRETPTLVGYTHAERLLGEQALIKLKSNYSNTFRAPHRLLALHRRPHLLQQQLALVKTKYKWGETGVSFFIKEGERQIQITAEQILIGLLAKSRQIVESHGLKPSLTYLSVPTYWGPEERFGFLRCGQLGLGTKVRLVDDWTCLGASYVYSRLQQLKQLQEMRQVVFLDVGYSKCSLFLVQFSQFQARLLDWQHLPYTGLKNMDQTVVQYYSSSFQKKYKARPIDHPRALPKLLEAVQKQRTVLSANSEYHLVLEYLLEEEDLTYNMNREEFQDLAVPVLADLAASMAAFQSRICTIPIYALELMGGGSRVPCIQSMASKIFGLEPSRSLNQSEAIASGSAFLAALDLKLVKFPYSVDPVVCRPFVARWKHSKQEMFHPKSRIPCQTVLNLGNEGLLEVTISLEENLKGREVALLKVRTPSKLIFALDSNKILTVKSQGLQGLQLYRRPQQQWKAIQKLDAERRAKDSIIVSIYEYRNHFESEFYWCKNKVDELKGKVGKEEIEKISKILTEEQKWIEEEHQKHCEGSKEEVKAFEQNIERINQLKNRIESLLNGGKSFKEFIPTQVSMIKLAPQDLKQRYQGLTVEIDSALGRPLQGWEQDRLVEVMEWGQKAYQEMEGSQWKGKQLTAENIQQAQALVKTLGRI